MPSKISLNVPPEISAPAKKKAYEAAILALWEDGAISASRAAEELGLTAHEFLDLLAVKGLPIVRGFDPQMVAEVQRKLAAGDRA
jgi:predicted HTH domain antitoxin